MKPRQIVTLSKGMEEMVVFKWWSRRYMCWEYDAERLDTIKMLKIPIKKKKVKNYLELRNNCLPLYQTQRHASHV